MSDNGPAPSMPSMDLRARLAESVEPVRVQLQEHLRETTARIDSVERELRELRQMRRDAEKMLYVIDPSSIPDRPKPGPPKGTRPGSGKGKRNIAENRVDDLEAWLRANLGPGEGFSAADLQRRSDFSVLPNGSVAFGIHALHDRGAIRYDRVGERGTKIYKLA